jgi:hypothetical protein
MEPRLLFPILAIGFLLLALWRGLRSGRWAGAPTTWLILAAIFGAVALWLRSQA